MSDDPIDVTQGTFSISEIAVGKFAVLWWHPSFGDWFRKVAEFGSRQRALAYMLQETKDPFRTIDGDLSEAPNGVADKFDALLNAAATLGKRGGDARAAALSVERRAEIARNAAQTRWGGDPRGERHLINVETMIDDLPAMFAAHPDGITVSVIMDKYGTSYNDTCAAMRWLDRIGKGQWAFVGGRAGNTKVLLPVGATYYEYPLSKRQEDVLRALCAMRKPETGNLVEARYRPIGLATGVSQPTCTQVLWALEQKGYLRRVRAAARNGAWGAVYQILKEAPIYEPSAPERTDAAHAGGDDRE